jgi:alpha-tubulin suppressor-like RCC1 family protein
MQWRNVRLASAVMMSAFMGLACGQPGAEEMLVPGGVKETAAPLMASALYDPQVKVPLCAAVASGCDTVNLVAGRDIVGPERNAPNTLGRSCLDGPGGVYRRDESIERVKVYTTDGSNMAPGKRVTIEVEVWAWSDQIGDSLDLYATADAIRPAWVFLTTLKPAGAGAQTLKASYILPAGPAVQAVRASLRYGGSRELCPDGLYNDRDDLAFTVQTASAAELSSRLAAGLGTTYQLREDRTLWAYGENDEGELGDGSDAFFKPSPVQTVGLTQLKAVAAGWNHALALKQDGTVWAWGSNRFGQLGDGTLDSRVRPVQVVSLSHVVAIAAHDSHSLAVKEDGTVWAWGRNSTGALGDGTAEQRLLPVQVIGLVGVKAVSAGVAHSVALKEDGSVWSWGNNGCGQLGNGTTVSSLTPVQATGLWGMTAISAGYCHTMALQQNKTVWTWGSNHAGQLGDGTTTFRPTPLQVPGLTLVTSISASKLDASVVTREDGSVWAWGINSYGQLGDGTTAGRSVPTKVPGFSGAVAVAAGGYHTVVLKQDGTVWGWGGGGSGELGTGGTGQGSLTPVQAPGIISLQ